MSQSDKVKQIHELCDKIKYIDLHEFKYNRLNRYHRTNSNPSLIQFVNISTSLTLDEINQLLINKNPKIRALGVMCLYQTDEQKQVLKIAQFLNDTSICFKPNPYPRFGNFSELGVKRPTEDELLNSTKYQKVSDVAKSFIEHYFKLSGHVYFDKELDQFIKERAEFEFTAGYLKLLKLKATGGISPFQNERINAVNLLRNRIDTIKNKTDRSIYKIYLSTDEYQLFSDDEIKNELKSLGRENIKLILQRKPPTNDPDLTNIQNSEIYNWEYNRMCKWILLNAAEVFEKDDVPFLLEQERSQREKTKSWSTNLLFPYWHIAASRIDTYNANNFIDSCLKIFNGENQEFERAELYVELLHLNYENNLSTIFDWIFNSYVVNNQSNERIDHFIYSLNEKNDLLFLRQLIQDPRFETNMKVYDIIHVAWQINKLNNAEIINDYLTREISHPFWLDSIESTLDAAIEEYPNETKEMFDKTKRLVLELKKY